MHPTSAVYDACLTAPFELQLLRRSDVVLTVDYHELLVLDFILVL
jgi:hypothetical protein